MEHTRYVTSCSKALPVALSWNIQSHGHLFIHGKFLHPGNIWSVHVIMEPPLNDRSPRFWQDCLLRIWWNLGSDCEGSCPGLHVRMHSDIYGAFLFRSNIVQVQQKTLCKLISSPKSLHHACHTTVNLTLNWTVENMDAILINWIIIYLFVSKCAEMIFVFVKRPRLWTTKQLCFRLSCI